MLSRILLSASVAIILLVGSIHLVYTAFTHKLDPADRGLEMAMKGTAMRISGKTTMWNAWTGFNFSHSLGLILFGLVYGYLVICRWEVLHNSFFLAILGLLVLLSYVVLSRVFWFRAPFLDVSGATVLYLAGLVCSIARR
jgi:hypothetical protein